MIYPFLKRFFWLPQAWLGLAFGFGIPMAFAANTGEVPPLAWVLLAANVFWTIAYDTEYAMVDRDDDLKLRLAHLRDPLRPPRRGRGDGLLRRSSWRHDDRRSASWQSYGIVYFVRDLRGAASSRATTTT